VRRTLNPPNRFTDSHIDWDGAPPPQKLELLPDASRSILSKNTSPDIPASYGLNPYRGCSHACAYCFARSYHEHLGFSVGTDFERRIVVKHDAPALLEAALRAPSWRGEPIAMSQVTDPYQPVERKLNITRRCLDVLARYRNPTTIITRSPLILRDRDLLASLAEHDAVRVHISIPIFDPVLCRAVEPGTAPPAARLAAIEALAAAGIPVGVSLAPVIPHLSDALIPAALQAARAAGARWAWMGLVRLPDGVDAYFEERLRATLPDRADAVMRALRAMRGGETNDRRFGKRMRGSGPAWEATRQLYRIWVRKLGLAPAPPHPDPSPFRVPGQGTQAALF